MVWWGRLSSTLRRTIQWCAHNTTNNRNNYALWGAALGTTLVAADAMMYHRFETCEVSTADADVVSDEYYDDDDDDDDDSSVKVPRDRTNLPLIPTNTLAVPSISWLSSSSSALLPTSTTTLTEGSASVHRSVTSTLRRHKTIELLDQTASKKATIDSKYHVPDWNRPLGRGTFGAVYRGTDLEDKNIVAIKKIGKNVTDNVTFQREMDALLHIRAHGGHPHLCGLREHFEEGLFYYLVLDFIQGGELFDHLVEQGAYSEADAARLLREVASALDYLHGIGIVHGDLKPENLMLSSNTSSNSVIQVVDFGCAHVAAPATTDSVKQQQLHSGNSLQRKATANTPAYAPPEILDKQKAANMEPSFDMWALGVILYIMLTGVHPFDLYGNATDKEIQHAILSGQKPPLYDSPLTAHLSISAIDLMNSLLQWNPQKRPTARDVLEHTWVRGDTARTSKMADSDKRLSTYKKFKTKLQARVFADMVSLSTPDYSSGNGTSSGGVSNGSSNSSINDVVTKRTSLIEKSFQMLDPDHRGYVTTKDLKRLTSDGGELSSSSNGGSSGDGEETELSLSGFSDLLAQNMKNRYFPKGHIIYHEGDKGHVMYFINSGTVQVYTRDGFSKQLRQSGDFFGEGALLHPRQLRSASIRCLTPVHAMEVSREYFEKYLASEEGAKLNLREKDKARKRQRAKAILQLQGSMQPLHLAKGEYVFQTGEEGNEMYILESGHVDVSVRGHSVVTVQPGEMCGEHSVIFGRHRNVTAQCTDKDGCHLHILRAYDFYKLLDLHPSLKESVKEICLRRDFQKALCFKIRKSFPKEEADLKAAFDQIDHNKSGKIELRELRNVIKQFDPTYTEADIRDILKSLDLSESGNLTWNEFLRIFGV